jgi:hypothetical protein
MARKPRNFEKEAKALQAQLTKGRWQASYDLRELEEAWARHILGVPARGSIVAGIRAVAERGVERSTAMAANEHLAAAEKWQAEIASDATGGGEGLSRWSEVLDFRLARAWLLSSVAAPDFHKQAKKLCRALQSEDATSAVFRRHLKALDESLGRGHK